MGLLVLAVVAQTSEAAAGGETTGVDRARMEDDLMQYRRATREEPDNSMNWVKLAVTLHEMDHSMPDGSKRVVEAVQAYSTALELGLTDQLAVSIYSNMGAILMSAGHAAKAIDALQAGIKLVKKAELGNEAAGGLYYNMGKAYGYIGDAEKATESYESAVNMTRGKEPHIYILASTSLKKSDQETMDELENASRYLEGDTDNLITKEVHVSARERRRRQQAGDDSGQIPASLTLLENMRWLDTISTVDRAFLHFALYAGYNKRGDLEAAWEHLRKGNSLYHGTMPEYSLAGEMQLMQMLMSVFRGSFGGGGYQDTTPIFVVGVPRSGSTLVEQILASHSKVWGAGEDTAMAPIIGEMFKGMNSNTEDQLSRMRIFGERYINEMRGRLPEGKEDVERIVDKMLRNLWNVGHIHMLLPQACVIHVVRHPLDTALSCYEQPFEGRGTPWAWDLDLIGQYILMNHAIARHWNQVLPGKMLTVMYEDMIANQAAVTRRILSHCGLEWEPAVMEFHRLKRGVQTASVQQVRQPLYNSAVYKYKKYAQHLAPLQEKLSSLISEYERELELAINGTQSVEETRVAGAVIDDAVWGEDEDEEEGGHSEL